MKQGNDGQADKRFEEGKAQALEYKDRIEEIERLVRGRRQTEAFYLHYADFYEFKLVNYFYGTEAGDRLLSAATSFVNEIPEVVYCDRFFSDQFVFVVQTSANRTPQEVTAFCNRYARALIETLQKNYPFCDIRFCCGIYKMEREDVHAAIDNAKMAWIFAKKRGLSSAVMFTRSQLDALAERKMKARELTLALSENRFTFYLQPKADLLTGQIVGAEALARLIPSDGNVICPDSFLPIMEENGSILDLDYHILEQLCSYMEKRMKAGLPVVCTSVNLSRMHVFNSETAERIHAIVEAYHIPSKLLEFELTETILLSDLSQAQAFGTKMKELHYRVSIDDFGAGYTDVGILQELDFDVLKLDKKFLSDDARMKTRNSAIIPALIDIAQKLNATVICEGVEREEQCRWLLDMGCRYGQGFYFSQAVSPDEFYGALQAWSAALSSMKTEG